MHSSDEQPRATSKQPRAMSDKHRSRRRRRHSIWLSALALALAALAVPSVAQAETSTTLEVQLNVAGDPVDFSVMVDGAVAATGGDGTTTGPLSVTPGVHTVGIGVGSSVPFFHVTNWECRDGGGAGAVVASGEVISIRTIDVPMADGAQVVCVGSSERQEPDLAVSVADSGGPFAAGDVIEYTIRYDNLGNVTTPSNIISVYVPSHTIANLTQSSPGWTCSPITGVPGTNCTIQLPFLAPGSGTVQFAVTVSPLPVGPTQTTFFVGCETATETCPGQSGIRSSLQVAEIDLSNNYASVTSLLGAACAPGSFSASGLEPCALAPAGTFVDAAGATEATPCPVGTYQPASGATSCLRAPIGSFVDIEGAAAPKSCPAGTSTVATGTASEADCLPDFDGDGSPDVVDDDDDDDGVLDDADRCAFTDLATDEAPAGLKKNRFWSDANGDFGGAGYTVVDTGGCSAGQIIDAAGLGTGHARFGVTRSALKAWVASV